MIKDNYKLRELTIRGDIKMSYDRPHIQFLLNTNNKDEYRHLLRAYNIPEEYLYYILLDLSQKPKS
jgi:hypothetical protein